MLSMVYHGGNIQDRVQGTCLCLKGPAFETWHILIIVVAHLW